MSPLEDGKWNFSAPKAEGSVHGDALVIGAAMRERLGHALHIARVGSETRVGQRHSTQSAHARRTQTGCWARPSRKPRRMGGRWKPRGEITWKLAPRIALAPRSCSPSISREAISEKLTTMATKW